MQYTDIFIFRPNEQLPSNTQLAEFQRSGNPNGEKPACSVQECIIPDKAADGLASVPGHTKTPATTPSLVIPIWRYSLSFLSDVYLCESFNLHWSTH